MTDHSQPETSPQLKRFQQWCGYIIGFTLLACLLVILLAATFAAVRAIL